MVGRVASSEARIFVHRRTRGSVSLNSRRMQSPPVIDRSSTRFHYLSLHRQLFYNLQDSERCVYTVYCRIYVLWMWMWKFNQSINQSTNRYPISWPVFRILVSCTGERDEDVSAAAAEESGASYASGGGARFMYI